MDRSEDHALIRAAARAFADKEIRPFAAELDEAEAFPTEIYRKAADAGFFGVSLPESEGGIGQDNVAYAIVMEEISRGYASVADELGNVEMIGSLLVNLGTADQKVRYLGRLLRGDAVSAFAISEAEAGSDVSNIRMTAQRDGDDWIINGEKLWIHNGPNFDFAVVLVRTDKEAGHRGMSTFLVDRTMAGLSSGRREKKMGQRASQVGPIGFTDVRVPHANLLGVQNRGFHQMMSILEKGRVGIAALSLGILQAALELSVGQAKLRRQFGQRIGDFQAVQFMLADMSKDYHAAKALTLEAARALDRGEKGVLECSIAKCFSSDAAVARTADAVQIFGGSGYIRGNEVERLYRDAKITQIYEGTNQIQRMIIARHLLAD